MEFLKFLVRDWQTATIILILLLVIASVFVNVLKTFLGIVSSINKGITIRKQGYPPPYCDAEGEYVECFDEYEEEKL